MSGCAIQSIINAAQSAATNGIKPKWDVDLNVPILSKSVSLRDVFEDGSIVSDMLSGMQGASFDPVTAEDLAEGGKYYYPDENCFGLRQGDYVINYKIDFPGTENMLNGTINDSMIDQFINNFVFEINDLVYWPWPFGTNTDVMFNAGDPSLDLGKFVKGAKFGQSLDVTLDLVVDIDQTCDGSDIKLKGIHSKNAEMSVNFVVVKYLGDHTIDIIAPYKDEIEMSYITIEGTKYEFDRCERKPDGDNKGLYYYAKDFITAADGDHSIHFNGSSKTDNTEDYDHLNIDGFKFVLKTPNPATFEETHKSDMLADISAGYKYRLKINVGIELGDDYDIICDIRDLTFDLGCRKTDLSMLNMLDTTSDAQNLGSYFTSNLSLANAAIYFDAESTLPVDVDLLSLFDNDSTSDISFDLVTGLPKVGVGSGNGAVITYFYDDNDAFDEMRVLHYDTSSPYYETYKDKAKINGKTSDTASVSKFGLYNKNSNTDEFLEKDNNGRLRRPSDLYFVNSFKTDETTDVKLSVINQQGGVKVFSGLILPLSFKVLEDKTPMNLLGALNMDNMIVQLSSVLKDMPVAKLNDFGLRIQCENKLPIGLTMSFLVTADETVDGKYMKYVVDMSSGTTKINTGALIDGAGGDDYAVSGYGSAEILAVARRDFSYRVYNEFDHTIDVNTYEVSADAVYTYNGSLFDFIYDHSSDAALAINLGLLETKDADGNTVAVKLRDDSYLSLKIDLIGAATIDPASMMSGK
ncbi:MAG: hypothetical protein IKQ61_05375 [Spirochaetales bacterium]|nr:hypothetical protein [Spirochaetales bacterium]